MAKTFNAKPKDTFFLVRPTEYAKGKLEDMLRGTDTFNGIPIRSDGIDCAQDLMSASACVVYRARTVNTVTDSPARSTKLTPDTFNGIPISSDGIDCAQDLAVDYDLQLAYG